MQELKIADFLQTMRKAHGYTQQDVANQLHISNKTISKWETGQALPDILSLKALAELYNVTVDEILNGQKNYTENPKNEKAVNKLLLVNASKKLNFFLLISSIIFMVGILLDVILTCYNYDIIGFGITIFLMGIGIAIYYIPYILLNKEDLIIAIDTKNKNKHILISIISGTTLLCCLALLSYSYSILFCILVGIAFFISIYFLLPKVTNSSKLYKAKIYILLLTNCLYIYNILFYLFAPINNITSNNFSSIIFVIFICFFIVELIIAITKKGKSIFPSIIALMISVLFIIIIYALDIANSQIFLNYYIVNPIVLVITSLALIVIDTILKGPIKNIKIMPTALKVLNIIATTLTIIILICYLVVPYKNMSTNIFDYHNINLVYGIVIIIALLIITISLLFIPIIKNLAPIICLFILCLISSSFYNGINKSETVFFYNFTNYSGLFSIILFGISIILIILILLIKIREKKKLVSE